MTKKKGFLRTLWMIISNKKSDVRPKETSAKKIKRATHLTLPLDNTIAHYGIFDGSVH